MVIPARNHLLQHHPVRVAAGVNGFHNLGGLGGGGGGVDLLHRVKGVLPVVNTGRRLDDDGIGKAQLFLGQLGGVHRGSQDLGVRVGDAELIADLVELGLFLDRAVQVGSGAGGNILGQLGLAADDHGGVVIGAAEQVKALTLMLCGKVMQNTQHGILVVHIGHGGKVYELGILCRRHRIAAVGVALHTVGLMECAGKVVAVQVCTKEYRDNVGHGKVHLQFSKIGFPLGGSCPRSGLMRGEPVVAARYRGGRGNAAPHPALTGHLPPAGEGFINHASNFSKNCSCHVKKV